MAQQRLEALVQHRWKNLGGNFFETFFLLPPTPFPSLFFFRWEVKGEYSQHKQTSENGGVMSSNDLETNGHSLNWNPSSFFWGGTFGWLKVSRENPLERTVQMGS